MDAQEREELVRILQERLDQDVKAKAITIPIKWVWPILVSVSLILYGIDSRINSVVDKHEVKPKHSGAMGKDDIVSEFEDVQLKFQEVQNGFSRLEGIIDAKFGSLSNEISRVDEKVNNARINMAAIMAMMPSANFEKLKTMENTQ